VNFTEVFIRRPVMTVLLSASAVVAGVIAYDSIPISALPQFDTPAIQVTGVLPGASPENMASSVATPLEKQFETISGVDVISSSSIQGQTQVTLEFNQERDIDKAAVDVQAALLRAQKNLPVEMTIPPSYRKVNPADAPIIFVTLTSPSMALSDLNKYADNLIAPTISTINGVAQINVNGQKRFAVRVRARPDALAARNMTMDDLAVAIKAANANTPVGTLDGPRQTLVIEANKQLTRAADFAQLIIAQLPGGNVVRLADVADVEDSVESVKTASWVNGERSITLSIQRQPDANTVATVDAIKAALPGLVAQVPSSVSIMIRNDRSVSIRAAIHDVKLTLGITAALVVLTIYLFLRLPSATIIPALSMPISLIGTIALMKALGLTIDNVSLLGITLAVEKVSVRPGKPTWFGSTPQGLVLGLPGNPASALACATLFLRPLMEAMLGRDPHACIATHRARLLRPLPANGAREHYLRARLEVDQNGQLVVKAFEAQDSSLISCPFRDSSLE